MQPTYTVQHVQEIVNTLDLKGIATISSVIQTDEKFYSSTDLNTIYKILADKIRKLKREPSNAKETISLQSYF